MKLKDLRRKYHAHICEQIIRVSGENPGYPNFADSGNKSSKEIAWSIVKQFECKVGKGRISGQKAGNLFQNITNDYLSLSFGMLQHIRPGEWLYATEQDISSFEQYKHLKTISDLRNEHAELAAYISEDYIVKSDIIVAREKVSNEELNKLGEVLNPEEASIGKLTSLLKKPENESDNRILHASISCKWTIRSDRSQNTRLEALNLIRNRKGKLPHIVAVTAEPMPTRIASLALGTGDLDCVYHFALNELVNALEELEKEDQLDMLNTLIEGSRLRDISDLPLDLAV